MDKALILTGAGGNVGSYLAHTLSQRKINLVLIVHKDTHRIDDLFHLKNVRILKTDLTDLEDLQAKLNKTFDETGWLPNRLIHTATARNHNVQDMIDTDPELWNSIIKINVIGTFNLLKCLIPYFRKNKNGKIVLFGSNVSRIGLPKGSAYAASKAAIANLGRTLAIEEADNNIIINTVSPGPIKIDDSQYSESYRKFREEYYNEKLREIPLKRCASFKDLLGVCDFLLSDENSYITGEEFFITGGKL
ncbi:MAG: SDR family oxidoreductase [Candidatus Cloacimonetes bacterium]|nr:SDR family oxidoreductase [Candidatus Cloacimonadota bacterium]MCF7813477.1 SDR family oxidoreductase [Candidatus Cloacimonadota bacterium]MCF7868600.1 SDR family oxidoreductase [Candidatus Cloacimonadota bacterium]MCF7883387.1 SDR family oxidoreductase [Candidatus Cloacimonadota bacterium]